MENNRGWMWVVGAAGAILLIGGLLWWFTRLADGPAPVPTGADAGSGLPVAGSVNAGPGAIEADGTDVPTSSTIEIKTALGNLSVNDFISDGVTVEDKVNQGTFVLAGELGYCLPDGSCPAAAPSQDFSISYDETEQFFTVVLLAEPLGEARSRAEQFLLAKLGISEIQLCAVKYFVGTPYWVNDRYSGKNLGFSSCAGATVLP